MQKKAYMVVTLALLVVALASFGVYARGMMGKSQSLTCERTDLEGAIVKNSRGDLIGIVNRIEDDGGQSFAIINHGPDSYYGDGGGFTAIPVAALKIAKTDQEYDHLKTVILNKTEKQLEAANAPFYDPTKMNNRRYEAKIDRFFGAKPSACA